MIILTTALEQALWILLVIVFTMVIYKWSKSKISNQTISVVIALVFAFLLFYRFPEVVWLIAIIVIIYWIYGSDIKKILNFDNW